MKVLYLGLLTLFGICFVPSIIQAQSNLRTINFYHWRNEPFKVLAVRINDDKVKIDTPFVAGNEDWFRGLNIEIQNTSNQKIEYIEASLRFPPEAGKTKNYAGTSIRYGSYKRFDTGEKMINPLEQPLRPGERGVIKLSDYQSVQKFLEGVGYSKLPNEFRIDVTYALFEDDTLWESGQIMIRDSNDLQSWHKRRN